MSARDSADEVRQLERAFALPPDAASIERVIAFEPLTGAGQRHKTMLIARWGRATGLDRYEP
jgi:hypothetical protein